MAVAIRWGNLLSRQSSFDFAQDESGSVVRLREKLMLSEVEA
jgi:hypothetical protein